MGRRALERGGVREGLVKGLPGGTCRDRPPFLIERGDASISKSQVTRDQIQHTDSAIFVVKDWLCQAPKCHGQRTPSKYT